MNRIRIVALVLIVAGVLALVYGKCSYTKETHEMRIGSLELAVKEKETINFPVWSGVGAIAAGAILLLAQQRESRQ